jgi:hypothetical protein
MTITLFRNPFRNSVAAKQMHAVCLVDRMVEKESAADAGANLK